MLSLSHTREWEKLAHERFKQNKIFEEISVGSFNSERLAACAAQFPSVTFLIIFLYKFHYFSSFQHTSHRIFLPFFSCIWFLYFHYQTSSFPVKLKVIFVVRANFENTKKINIKRGIWRRWWKFLNENRRKLCLEKNSGEWFCCCLLRNPNGKVSGKSFLRAFCGEVKEKSCTICCYLFLLFIIWIFWRKIQQQK